MTPDKDCGVRISSAVAAIAQFGFDGMKFMNFWIFYLMPACGMALFQSLVVILINACVRSPCQCDETEHTGRCGAGELDMHSNNGWRTCTNRCHFDGHAVTPCKFLEWVCNWYWFGSSLRSLYFGDPWCEPKTTQTKTYSETLKAFFGWRTTTEWLSNLCAGPCTQQTGYNLCRFATFFCLWLDFTMEPAVQTWLNSNLPCD